MKQIYAAALALAVLAPHAVVAEDDGFNLMEEGAQLFFRGLMQEMDPALQELESIIDELEPSFLEFAEVMGPALQELLDTVDNISYYDAPEVLENGDIIIRRREDAPPYEPQDDAEAEAIEL